MNTQARLRWGILGAARVNERLLPAIVQAANAELVAIASRRPGAAAETLKKHAPQQQGVKTYDSLEALLADDAVQAVYLPMANEEHTEWVLRAIEHGKHVLCEKPMALKVEDIEAIEAAAAKHQVTVMEGFMYCFHPQYARAQEIIQSGIIGDVRFVRASYAFTMRPARMYRINRPIQEGGGAMWDIGPYAIHSLRRCFGAEPVAATAMAKYVESGADVTMSGVLDFGDGRHGHFDISFETSRRSEYEITGTKGGLKCHTVWLADNEAPLLSWWTEDGRFWQEKLAVSSHFVNEIEHFSDCVLHGKPPLLTLEDAKGNCRVINAALQSAAEGRVVKI
ncbi:MAG TPA: Gfo/Idh/MocA family oxidoreductase [Methylophilaceae bacterium]|nr:Gfo/Idh/MocA family oxidoreductase [Methylophilaceae bacterium]